MHRFGASGALTIFFFPYERQMGAFLGDGAATAGLLAPAAPPPAAQAQEGPVARLQRRVEEKRQLCGVCLAGVLSVPDIDLSQPPLARGPALLIFLRISSVAFVWVVRLIPRSRCASGMA